MYCIKDVYGKVDRIRNFYDEEKGKNYKYMDKYEIVRLAHSIVQEICNKGYKTVIVSESGSVPLIEICKQIALKQNVNIKWFSFKSPRSKEINLSELILNYLTYNEKKQDVILNNKIITRERAIIQTCNETNFLNYLDDSPIDIKESLIGISKEINIENKNKLLNILKGTDIYNVFNSPFLFFDEYVFSGKILKNFTFYANLFSYKPEFTLGVYAILIDNVEEYKEIAFALYNNKTIENAYNIGIYPFEDRIDIIGFYYYINKKDFLKQYISNLKNKINFEIGDGNLIIEHVLEIIEKNKLLDELRNFCRKKQIKEYVNKEDIVRYFIKLLEEKCFGISEVYSLLEQSFEMYAPIWLPMPREFHYDYWKAFERLRYSIEGLITEKLKLEYIENRDCLISEIIDIYDNRRKKFFEEIINII